MPGLGLVPNSRPGRNPVVEIMCSASVFRLASEFDAFLYAPVGADRNGLLLSVISALARLDLDPWLEAAKLAQLPVKTAAERLAGLIATLPDEALAQPDPRAIADRLIGLLPRQGGRKVAMPISVSALVSSKAQVIALCATLLVGIIVAQWLFSGLGNQTPSIGATAPAAHAAAP
jgi:hypothetical protein